MEKIEQKTWEEQIEKTKEAIKESFWGDFLFGGLLVSGIFMIKYDYKEMRLLSYQHSLVKISF